MSPMGPVKTLPALIRLAVSGGTADALRIVLTAFATLLGTVAMLSAATVLSIAGVDSTIAGPQRYSNSLLEQAGLRPGVAATLVLLCVPVLFLAGQCARIGAPARDRRLAAVRMAGATPRQASTVVAIEAAVAAALGALCGLAVFLVGRLVLDDPSSSGVRPLPTDVLPPAAAFVLVLLVVPLAGAALSVLALRRVRLTPFGVVRRARVRPPRLLPLVLLAVGLAGLLVLAPVSRSLHSSGVIVVGAVLLVLCIGIGLSVGAAVVSATIGAVVAGRASRPAWLIAGRRLAVDPWAASRALGALLLTVFVGGAVIGVRDATLGFERAQQLVQQQSDRLTGQAAMTVPVDPFYARSFDLAELAVIVAVVIAALALLVAAAEQVVERRRTLAALVANGTPRGVLARSALLQCALPLVPGVVVAAVAGWVGAHGVYGWTAEAGGMSTCSPPPSLSEQAGEAYCNVPAHLVTSPPVHLILGVPWGQLLGLVGVAIVATLLLTALSLTLLRRSTDIAELRAA